MLFFFFRVLVNTVILFATVAILPGLSVSSTWWQYLVMGTLFTLLNEFVRPLFVFISSRMLIRSFGLFIVIVNALVFELLVWVGERLGMGAWQVSSIVTVVLAGAIIGILMAFFDAVLGINRPALRNLEEGRGVWRFVSRMPLSSRGRVVGNVRFMQVWDTMWCYGLDIALSKTPLGPVRDAIANTFNPDARGFARLSTPAQVREMLQVLGPTYVKFGQMVSSRSDSLSAEWKRELNALQSNVAPFPGAEAVALVEEALGAPVTTLYATFERDPFARLRQRRFTV